MTTRRNLFAFFAMAIGLGLVTCTDYPEFTGKVIAGASTAGTGGSVDIIPPEAGAGGEAGAQGDPCASDNPPAWCAPPECGDGIISGAEVCDDGNADAGDGCSAACDVEETDYECRTPGEPCVYTVQCGDGNLGGAEECDDANTTAGDGCSDICVLEDGWICPTAGGRCIAAECGDGFVAGNEECEDGNATSGDGCSDCQVDPGYVCEQAGEPCRETVCNDGVKEGDEPCDDGNDVVGDGCNPFCEVEPDCSGILTVTGCTSACGDGMMLEVDDEGCDDGNTVDGDGCDSSCQIEPGYECSIVGSSLPPVIDVPMTFRDFIAYPYANPSRHPDFEEYSGRAETPGLVQSTIGGDGKPVYTGICEAGSMPGPCPYNEQTTSQADFDQWYNDVPSVNITMITTLPFAQLAGNTYQYSDNSLFPFNDAGWVATGDEDPSNGNNFGFTSELRYWFEYGEGQQLDFSGDDDVWVFVNGYLAVDLGGLHPETAGSVTLDAAAAAAYQLEVGRIYEIALFHAERHTDLSNFILTLGGFVKSTSSCDSICGNGIVTGDEVCDDGDNNGEYGYCGVNCDRLGPHCGDGLLRVDHEECDNGVNLSTYQYQTGGDDCAPGCVLPPYCGDGNVDSLFGEVCDDGVNDGSDGRCQPDCGRGAICGDGILQESAGEQCDDGNNRDGDTCSADCKLEQIH